MMFFKKNDKYIKSAEDIENNFSLRTLTEIPLKESRKSKESQLISYYDEKSEILKAFRRLRINIQFLNVNNNNKKIILITSPNREDGKSFVVANMAISFAEIGNNVIIIDADMKSGIQDKIFNIPNNLGLSNYLSNLDTNGVPIKESLNKYINETAIKKVSLITSGTVPPNSSELLALPRLEELFKDLSVFYDVIIVDGTSTLETTDSLILTKFVTSTILVTSSNKTKKEDLEKAKSDLQNVKENITGVILNKVKTEKPKKEKIEETKIEKEENKSFAFKFKNFFNMLKGFFYKKTYTSKRKLLTEAINKEIVKDEKIKNAVKINKDEETKNEVKTNKNEETKNTVKINKNEETKNEETKNEAKINKEIKNTVKINKDEEIAIEKETNNEIINKNIQTNNLNIIDERKIQNRENIDVDKILDRIKVDNDKSLENVKIHITEGGVEIEYSEDLEEKDDSVKESKFKNLFKNFTKKFSSKSKKNVEKELNEDNIYINQPEQPEKINNDDESQNENTVLVIVDAENLYCRVFSENYFTEKLIRNIDSKMNTEVDTIDQYSNENINGTMEYLMLEYNLTKKQVKMIDPLIYNTLCIYDSGIKLEKKVESNKAKEYVLCMSKDYHKSLDENNSEYKVRCQRLRKKELSKLDLEIEYKLDNLWSNSKLKFNDKLAINKYAKFFEINNKFKTQYEINKSINNKAFYDDVIKSVKNEKNIENEETKSESTENVTIENATSKENINGKKIISEGKRRLSKKDEKRKRREKIASNEPNRQLLKKEEKKKRKLTDKEEKRKIRLINIEEKRNERAFKKREKDKIKQEKEKIKEETKKQKAIRRKRKIEDSRIEEELLEDNLYPKTKSNKDLF